MAKKDDLAAAKAERDKALKAVQAEEKKAADTNEHSKSYYDARNRYRSAQRKLNELESASKPKKKNIVASAASKITEGISEVGKETTTKIKTAKNQKVPDYQESADAIINGILSRASTSDPTATRTTTNVSLSPLPSGGVAGSVNATQGGEILITPLQMQQGAISQYRDPKTGVFTVVYTDPASQAKSPVLILKDDNTGRYIVKDADTGFNEVVNSLVASPDGIKKAKEDLIKRGRWSGKAAKASYAKGNEKDNDFLRKLYQEYTDLTSTNFSLINQGRPVISYNESLNGSTSLAGTRSTVSTTYTPSNVAARDITSFIQNWLDRGATGKEISDYVTSLHRYESEHPDRSTVTTDILGTERSRTTYRGAQQSDADAIKVAILSKALNAAGIDPSSISKTGGLIAQGMSKLKQTGAEYGINIDDKNALDHMINSIKPGGSVDAEANKIKNLAKTMYSNLSQQIDQGLTIRDIAKQYSYIKSKVLELPDMADPFDPDIQAALRNNGKAGTMSESDFIRLLRKNPNWKYTQNAQDEASSYVNKILNAFGMA